MQKFGYTQTIADVKILHLSEGNAYSPTVDALLYAVKIAEKGINITVVEENGKGDYSKIDVSDIQSILVTTRIGVDQKK